MTNMVTSLSLASNNMDGTLPTEFGTLVKMADGIKLKDNAFSGALPTQFGLLTRFTSSLTLSKLSLTSTIPTQFGMMANLTEDLIIRSNKLCGDIPTQLERLTAFTTVKEGWDTAITDGNNLGTACYDQTTARFTALSALYASSGPDYDWDRRAAENWLSSDPCDKDAKWAGVNCTEYDADDDADGGSDGFGEVSSLELFNNTFDGSLPTQVG